MIVGYLIKNAEDKYLSSFLAWVPCDSYKDAFVHPAENLELISHKMLEGKIICAKKKFMSWSGPKCIIPACWSKDGGVELCGDETPWTL